MIDFVRGEASARSDQLEVHRELSERCFMMDQHEPIKHLSTLQAATDNTRNDEISDHSMAEHDAIVNGMERLAFERFHEDEKPPPESIPLRRFSPTLLFGEASENMEEEMLNNFAYVFNDSDVGAGANNPIDEMMSKNITVEDGPTTVRDEQDVISRSQGLFKSKKSRALRKKLKTKATSVTEIRTVGVSSSTLRERRKVRFALKVNIIS